jgi:Na+-translocating ferredoxin:NAD+ oxidoreductase RnfD subunit
MTARERTAARVARWSALGSSLVVGIYLAVRLRPLAPAWRATARTIAAVTNIICYYLTYRIVKKVALEWQR